MIVCAAIKVKLPGVKPPFNDVIIPCLRHCDGFYIVRSLCGDAKFYRTAEEGFINHKGDFMSREDAWNHAVECGQIPAELKELKRQRGDKMLYSEDLY